MAGFGGLFQKLSSSILEPLQGLSKAGKNQITVVKTGGNKCVYTHLQLSSWHNGSEFSNIS